MRAMSQIIFTFMMIAFLLKLFLFLQEFILFKPNILIFLCKPIAVKGLKEIQEEDENQLCLERNYDYQYEHLKKEIL